ncbi:MAG: PAS domain S-box protein [Spirochaetes bacterium]|nr:PAS domain S-box protein [Spirochaetota bacterium]
MNKNNKNRVVPGPDLYRMLTDNSSDVLWTMSLDGHYDYMSPSVTALAGYTQEEASRLTIASFIVPEYVAYVQEILVSELAKPREERLPSKVLELQIIAKDGSIIDVEVSATWIYDEKGNPIGVQGSTRDIRKRKMALEALQESEERYRALVERSLDLIFIHDFNGNFIDANAAALKTLGYSKEDVKHLNFVSLMSGDQVAHAFELIRQILEKGGQTELTEFEVQTKDGRRIILETQSFLIYKNRKPYAIQGVGREITERKRALEEQRWTQEKLEMVVQQRTSELKEINKKLIQEIIVRKQVENELRISENSLRSQNEIMLKELESARLIQKALMPKEVPDFPRLAIDYRYLPLEAVGGDYFSFTPLEEGGLGVFVGDVTGHGVPAALFLSLVRSISNKACRKHGMTPGRYIELINNEVYRGMPSYYLTAMYGVFQHDREDAVTFTFARGGHPYPILYRRDTDQVEFVKTSGNLLGWQENRNFMETTISMKRGDRLFLYTDGIPDTVNPRNEMLDSQQEYFDLFRDPDSCELSKKLDAIINDVMRFKEGVPLVDDIILIGVEVI